MKQEFRLDDHIRRPQPLAPPPDGYFDRLPMQVMQRVQPGPARRSAGAWDWLTTLPMPLRTALASLVLLIGFTVTFFVSQPPTSSTSPDASLAAVPRAQVEQYLLSNDDRLSLTDLAEFTSLNAGDVADGYLSASPDEVQAALDAQPLDESNYL
ncbi:hypothetical protein [Hymenobacter jejuensis]|uniref:Uncharacterized protein n=1 Tax=Hymenobacter jejuensis TaxID=2502781 RepID=A0A5B8A5L9_9BACT|nr:hypothetical protein [Hymenobacter jejuensis]QDA61502.1 hypothetical protein FHG12_15975 [Hymenobacter jejuensis]